MSNNHPLTDEILHDNFNGFYDSADHTCGYSIFDADDMRSLADWQLKQDQKMLEDFLEEFSCRGHSADAILDLRMFVENFKSYMRPTRPTQEDS